MHVTTVAIVTILGLCIRADAEYVDIEKDQRNFLNNLDWSGKLFTPSNWYLHNTDLFRKMKSRHAAKFMGQLLERSSDETPRWKDHSTAKTFFKNIRAEDIESINEKDVCNQLGLGIEFNPASFASAGSLCAEELVKLAKRKKFVLESLPPEIFTTHPQLATILGSKFLEMCHKTLNVVLQEGNVCKYVTATIVANEGDQSVLRLISPKCFARLKDVSGTDINNLSEMNGDILANLKGSLTLSTISHISLGQIKHIEGNPEVCRELSLQHLSSNTAPGLGEKCILEYLKGSDERRPRQLGDLWRKFKTTVLSELLSGDVKLIRNIHPHDYQFMEEKLLNSTFAVPKACEYINRDAKFSLSSGIKIGTDCFSRLPTKLQPIILHGIKSPVEDLLSKVDSQMMSSWILQTRNDTLKGFQVLKVVTKESSSLIKHLSEKSKDHACASIPNAATLLVEKWFVDHLTEGCARALPFAIRISEGQKNVRVWVLQNLHYFKQGTYEHASTTVPHYTAEIVEMMVEKEGICKNMPYNVFKLLPSGAKKSITTNCFSEFRFKDKLSEGNLSGISTEFYRRMTASTFGELSWNAIPTNQLGNIGEDIPKGQIHPFNTMEKLTFHGWSGERISQIKPKQWPFVQPVAFAGLSAVRIENISAESLRYWSYEQVDELKKEAVLALSIPQLQNVGVQVDATAVRALSTYLDSMPEAHQQIIKTRISTSPRGWKTIVLFAIFAVVFLILLGLVVYWFLRYERDRFTIGG